MTTIHASSTVMAIERTSVYERGKYRVSEFAKCLRTGTIPIHYYCILLLFYCFSGSHQNEIWNIKIGNLLPTFKHCSTVHLLSFSMCIFQIMFIYNFYVSFRYIYTILESSENTLNAKC